MSAFFAGLDVSDLTCAVCVIDDSGAIIKEECVETKPASIARALKPYSKLLKQVAFESGSKSAWLHKELTKKRLPIVCVDARITAANLKRQRNKTDKNDARGIANVLRTGWYAKAYIKSDEAFRLRFLLTHRRALKKKAIALELTLRMSIKVFGASLEKKAGNIEVKWPTRSPDPLLSRLVDSTMKGRRALLTEVSSLDSLIKKYTSKDPVCQRLMTVPGVGPLTALTFKAGVDDPARFSSSRTVGAGRAPGRGVRAEWDLPRGRSSRIIGRSGRSLPTT